MTEKQRENVKSIFNSKTNRQKLQILAHLSKPWIEQGAIKHAVNTLEEIFTLQDLSKGAENVLDKKVKQLSKLIGRRAGTSMGGPNNLKPKRRKARRKN